MGCTGELEQNVDLQRCDLRHSLCRMQQLVLCDRLETVVAGCIQVDTLDELDVVEKRAERHEVGKANFVSFGDLKTKLLQLPHIIFSEELTWTRLSLTSGVSKCFFTVSMISWKSKAVMYPVLWRSFSLNASKAHSSWKSCRNCENSE